ncbi:LmbE family protein [Pelomyxa schiedti]|nr:LmbE family protein [Pelomyxa schiedti]
MVRPSKVVLCCLAIVGFCCSWGNCAVPQPLDYSSWQRVLMIAAHPDDVECTAGGLVYLLTQQGKEVFYLIVTNGDKGCSAASCKNWTQAQIAEERQKEQIAAGAVLGVPSENIVFLTYEDAMLPSYPHLEVVQDLVLWIRTIKPDVVMSWWPYPSFTLLPSAGWDDIGFHPDHQILGSRVLDAKFDAGVDRAFTDLPYPSWDTKEFYMWDYVAPTHYVALDEQLLQAKTDAYLQHTTQYPSAFWVKEFMLFSATHTAINANISETVPLIEGYTAYW